MVWLIVSVLVLIGMLYAVSLGRAAWRERAMPGGEALVLGAVTNFFDTLGIGSFAPTMAWLRFRRLVPDRLIPLTMMAGFIMPSLLQGVIFLILLGVAVSPWLIVGASLGMAAGGLLGVRLVVLAPVRLVQALVGLALLVAAFFFILANLGMMPAGGTATSLPLGPSLAVIAAFVLFGILACFGVGHFAPSIAMISLMGMDPRLAFPIMATAGGFAGALIAGRSLRLVRFDYRIVLGLAIGAVPAVLVAAFLVKEMPLDTLRWLVVVVVSYAAFTLLASAARSSRLVPEEPAAALIQ